MAMQVDYGELLNAVVTVRTSPLHPLQNRAHVPLHPLQNRAHVPLHPLQKRADVPLHSLHSLPL
jgi:hypothetical protein